MNLENIKPSSLMSVNEKDPLLPKAIPKHKLHSAFISLWQNKKHIKKYFGRKKIYAENRAGRTTALHRSKYFLKFKFTNTRIFAAKFKSLGNLIFFATDLILKGDRKVSIYSRIYYSNNTHLIPWKRAFVYCKQVYSTDEVSLRQKYMFFLKSLRIKISQQKQLNKLTKVIPNLRLLESITLEYTTDVDLQPGAVAGNCTFFTHLNKLPRLQSFYFDTAIPVLQKEAIQKDVQGFYLKLKIPIVHVTIQRRVSFSEKGIKALECLLKKADCLCLEFSNNNFCCNEDFSKRSNNQRQRLVSQSKRAVYFADSFWPQDNVNINLVLSNCDSLKFLYMKMSTNLKFWMEVSPLRPEMSQWCQSLQSVVLDFGFFYINPVFSVDIPKEHRGRVYDVLLQEREDSKLISKPSKLFFTSPILNLMHQLRENAVSWENLSLSLCLSNLDSKNYNLDKGIAGFFETEKKRILGEFLEETSLVNKLRRLDLCSRGNICVFPLNHKSLSLESLERLRFGFCKKKEAYYSSQIGNDNVENNWDQYLGLNNGISYIKQLKIETSRSLKIQPFGTHLVTACHSFQNLQVLEIIDWNKMPITFDLVYGLLTNVLKSKNIKRVLISTSVTNGFYSRDSSVLFPQQVASSLQQIEKGLFAQLEMRVRELTELKLEEITVGRLTGFIADYILYNKDLGRNEKVLWTENEFQELKLGRFPRFGYYLKILGFNSSESQNEDLVLDDDEIW